MPDKFAYGERERKPELRQKRTENLPALRYAGGMLRLRIRELREAQGWTLNHLARESGISVSYLSEIENHKKTVNSRRIEQIARALSRDPHDLIEDSGSRDDVSELVAEFVVLSPDDRAMILRLARSLHRP